MDFVQGRWAGRPAGRLGRVRPAGRPAGWAGSGRPAGPVFRIWAGRPAGPTKSGPMTNTSVDR